MRTQFAPTQTGLPPAANDAVPASDYGNPVMMNRNTQRPFMDVLAGPSGEYLQNSNGAQSNKSYRSILALIDSVIVVTSDTITNIPASVTIKAGTLWPGHFTALTVTSGAVVAYNA